MWKSFKFWGIVLLLLVLATGGWYYYKSQQSAKAKGSYTTGTVEKGTISIVIDSTGTINPVKYVDVSTTISGTLKEVLVKENQQVQAGDTIALIDSRNVEANASNARSVLANAQTDFDRYAELYKQGAISAQAYDNALLKLRQAQATYDIAASNLSDTRIVAPMSGTVIGEPLKAGQTVSQGLSSQMIIATIADLSQLEIYLTVDETDIGSVEIGQRVSFTVDAYTGETFEGKVSGISKGKKGAMGTTSSTVVYYTIKVSIPEEQSPRLLPTMTARATIHGKEAPNTLLVPLTAIRSDRTGDFVYVIENGNPKKQNVKVGITGDSKVQILDGLKEGQEIVVSGDVATSAKTNIGPI